ncbi:MAG: hypothetical protein JNL90_11030 [Planctomycetes bacterium]|nr:hypothetical protein [Planctomycetota bacterium]
MNERSTRRARALPLLVACVAALFSGCNQVAKAARSSTGSSTGSGSGSGGSGSGGGSGATAIAEETRAAAPRPQLGAGVPAPGYLLGLSPEEAAAVKRAPAGSRLAKLRELVLQEAQQETAPLAIEPGRHLVDRRMNKDVPAAQSLDLGFLIEWNERLDAQGLAYAITGDAKYAQRVDAELLPWANYSPPNGEGLTKGGEPGIYHRNFFGAFRAAEQCWPALSPAGRAAAVKLAITVQDRMEDWWKRTPWERGNHAAATAQTGIYAAILLVRAAADDAKRIAPADAAARLEKYLNAGANLPQQSLVGGEKRQPGLLGFGPQALIGVLTEQNAACYRSRDYATDGMLGASIDFFYKPPDRRFGYHALLTHHLLTAYWAVVRSGLDQKALSQASEVRRAIGQLLEFTRPYLERGEVLVTAKGKATDPARDARTREIVAMAARLFPEKAWLEKCRLRGEPVRFTELYAEAAKFQ